MTRRAARTLVVFPPAPILRRLTPVLLLAAALAAPGCANEQRSSPLASGVVDTFDDANTTAAIGNPWEAVGGLGGDGVTIAPDPGGYANTPYGLLVTGYRSESATTSEVVGVRTSIALSPRIADPNRADVTADARGFTGLALAVKGTPGTYIVQIGSALVTDFNFYNAYVQVGPEWTEFKIPFSDFKQESFGAAVPWTGDQLTHVAVFPILTGEIAFTLDQVRFYR